MCRLWRYLITIFFLRVGAMENPTYISRIYKTLLYLFSSVTTVVKYENSSIHKDKTVIRDDLHSGFSAKHKEHTFSHIFFFTFTVCFAYRVIFFSPRCHDTHMLYELYSSNKQFVNVVFFFFLFYLVKLHCRKV